MRSATVLAAKTSTQDDRHRTFIRSHICNGDLYIRKRCVNASDTNTHTHTETDKQTHTTSHAHLLACLC